MAVGAKLRYEVLRRDNYTCRFCGSSAPDVHLQIDHVVPRSRGGTDAPSNLQVLCDECNAGKSAAMPERWLTKEVARVALLGRPTEPDEDDFAQMYAYMDAYEFLESQPSAEVLRACMRVWADVYPYRPTGPETITAAAKVIREHPAPTGDPF